MIKVQIKDNGFMVKVVFARPKSSERTPAGHQPNTSRTPAEQQHYSPSPAVLKLLVAIGDNWVSAKELRKLMGFKSKSSFIKNYLSPAQKEGLIRLEDAQNPQSPYQRYGLTEKGMLIFKNQS